ncbi:hypothetical protein SERLADRAFT_432480 [Serpula lacrymans var. lacrymans S7.9]|uniref:Uncharacterized protein n=1 Tax=Serpula lacrymans var. lacrymans (strain S7.9) TaxID=578457 RepID=F8NFG1_SERL9|nr:uncharacterized protein SERLADRAFT_432480 [Serpula lacrymans var. lacrymans S7.9]EGO30840.1 hypothetical protein SERLADRAFT_432480 [Serpula lacrymans var. lacrymans S7.9]
MSQTTPIDQQTHSPRFPPYLAEPQVLTEAQWAHRLALTREQTNIVDATELMSDRRAYFYLFHQSNIICPTATYPLDTFHRWQNALLVADELHAVTVSLGLLVDELTRDNNSVLNRIHRMTLEEELREWRERSGQSIPTPRWLNHLLSLPATTGHPFPGHHPPTSPQSPQLAYPPSPPDLVLPAPAPSSPTHSFATDSIVPKANAVEELQVILIPTRPTTPLLQLPPPCCSRQLCRQRPERESNRRSTPMSSNESPQVRRPLRSNEGATSASLRGSKRPSPISDHSNPTQSQSSSERRRRPHIRHCYACQEYGHCAIYCRCHTCSMCGLDVPGHRANECNRQCNLPFVADSWGLDNEHNDLDEDAQYNVDGELGDFGAV